MHRMRRNRPMVGRYLLPEEFAVRGIKKDVVDREERDSLLKKRYPVLPCGGWDTEKAIAAVNLACLPQRWPQRWPPRKAATPHRARELYKERPCYSGKAQGPNDKPRSGKSSQLGQPRQSEKMIVPRQFKHADPLGTEQIARLCLSKSEDRPMRSKANSYDSTKQLWQRASNEQVPLVGTQSAGGLVCCVSHKPLDLCTGARKPCKISVNAPPTRSYSRPPTRADHPEAERESVVFQVAVSRSSTPSNGRSPTEVPLPLPDSDQERTTSQKTRRICNMQPLKVDQQEQEVDIPDVKLSAPLTMRDMHGTAIDSLPGDPRKSAKKVAWKYPICFEPNVTPLRRTHPSQNTLVMKCSAPDTDDPDFINIETESGRNSRCTRNPAPTPVRMRAVIRRPCVTPSQSYSTPLPPPPRPVQPEYWWTKSLADRAYKKNFTHVCKMLNVGPPHKSS